MKALRRKITIILFVFLQLAFFSCSTKKNTVASRAFHNLTAYYNIYYNALDSYKSGLKRIEDGLDYNFDDILPIFYYTDETAIGMVSTDMDRALRKSSKLITRHSIKAKPKKKKGPLSQKDREFLNKKEYNKFIDEGYLLVGKARVYKKEYAQALQTFSYVKNQFPGDDSEQEAYIWIARIYIEQGEYKNAEDILISLEENRNFPKKLNDELYATFARLYLVQDNYKDAVTNLELALESTKTKELKIRYTYIIAQLYQKTEAFDNALTYYQKVLRMSPKYEFVFNAQVSMASSVDQNTDNKEVKKQLLKMLKDDKNIDFQDQIYYGLAEMAYRENNLTQALEYYHLSVATSKTNLNQKGISYLRLASIYFDKAKYNLSKAYFDSTLTTIESNYPNYEELYSQTQNLTKLVTQLYIVENQDSLQRIAALPEAQRNAIINGIIDKINKEEERLKEEEAARRMDIQTFNQNRYNPLLNTTESSKWYFYNQSTISYGQNEFKLKWGSRKLEDNWRRKNKRANLSLDEIIEEQKLEDLTDPKANLNKKTKEYYLVDLPLSDSLMKISKQKVEEALYTVGEIYKNDFQNFDAAIESFLEFNRRFPYSEYTIMSYYYLYQMHNLRNDIQQADLYKNLIINKYPKSKYASFLIDPDYFKKIDQEKQNVETFYQQTYNSFVTGEYNQVINFVEYANTNYKESDLLPKFNYLKTMATGHIKSVDVFKKELETFIAAYPKTEESEHAKEFLEMVKVQEVKIALGYELSEEDTLTVGEEIETTVNYVYKEFEKHLFFMIYAKKDVNFNQLNFSFVSFNVDFFLDDNLIISPEEFNNQYALILVKEFKNAELAKAYLSKINEEKERLLNEVISSDYRFLIISQSNYNLFIESKSLAGYLKFFQSNYSENKQ